MEEWEETEMKSDQNSTLDKGLDMLFQFTETHPKRSMKEMIDHLGVSRSTAYRLLETLKAKNLIQEDSPGRYRLGLSVLQLTKVVTHSFDLIQYARPIMRELALKYDETVILTAVMDQQAMCIENIESSKPVKLSFVRGKLQPLCRGASAKILFAFLDEETQERLLQQFSENGMVEDDAVMRTSLDHIRRDGYAVSNQDLDPGAWAAAAPILGVQDRLMAGLSVAAPTFRLEDEDKRDITQSVIESAGQLSETMKMIGN